MQAARHGRVEELEELLQQVHVNSANEAGNTLLIVAAQNNQRAVCKALHDRGADLNSINRQVKPSESRTDQDRPAASSSVDCHTLRTGLNLLWLSMIMIGREGGAGWGRVHREEQKV